MSNARPRYGASWRHVYGESCPIGARYMLKSETRTRAGRVVCPRCSGDMRETRVAFAVIPWRADARYSLADAIATYARQSAADADAGRRYEADPTSPYVVRAFVDYRPRD